jgi:hypothetical protein
MKRKAAFETSSSVSRCSSSRDFGPAIDRPTIFMPSGSTRTEPSAGSVVSNQRMWYTCAWLEPHIMKRPSPALAIVKSPISLPWWFNIGVSTMRPVLGIVFVITRSQPGLGARAGDHVLGEVRDLGHADRLAHGAAFGRCAGSRWSGGS